MPPTRYTPTPDLPATAKNKVGVLFNAADTTRLFAEYMRAIVGRLKTGQYTLEPKNVVVNDEEVILADGTVPITRIAGLAPRVELQATTPGTQQVGHANISGTMIAGAFSGDGSGLTNLPAIAITDTFVVADEPAMLALTAEKGDVAVRTDESKTYILAAEPASTFANWTELLTPGGGGSYVSLAVTLASYEVGVAAVDSFYAKNSLVVGDALAAPGTVPMSELGPASLSMYSPLGDTLTANAQDGNLSVQLEDPTSNYRFSYSVVTQNPGFESSSVDMQSGLVGPRAVLRTTASDNRAYLTLDNLTDTSYANIRSEAGTGSSATFYGQDGTRSAILTVNDLIDTSEVVFNTTNGVQAKLASSADIARMRLQEFNSAAFIDAYVTQSTLATNLGLTGSTVSIDGSAMGGFSPHFFFLTCNDTTSDLQMSCDLTNATALVRASQGLGGSFYGKSDDGNVTVEMLASDLGGFFKVNGVQVLTAQQSNIADLIDNSGGTPGPTLDAITDATNPGSADLGPVQNAIASINADVVALKNMFRTHGFMASI